jgi:hypothetical protein
MPQDPEHTVRRLQARQHGAVSRKQALDAGMTPDVIDGHLRARRLVALYHGVYVDGAARVTSRTKAAAACLACGPKAAAGGRTAAMLHRLPLPEPDRPEIVVPRPRTASRAGITVMRRTLRPGDVAIVDGVPATVPALTLVHLAAVLDDNLLAVALDAALRESLVTPQKLADREAAVRTAAGAGRLREMLELRGARPIGSVRASEFFELLRRYGLPLPIPEYPVWTPDGEKFIDFAYPDEMVAIEIDGWKHHVLDPMGFVREKARQNELEQLGWTFRRFAPKGVRLDPTGTAVTVGEALGLRPSRWVRVERSALKKARDMT